MELFSNSTRLGSFLQTMLYLTGVPIYVDPPQHHHHQSSRTVREPQEGAVDLINNLNIGGDGSRSLSPPNQLGLGSLTGVVGVSHPDDPLNTMCYGVLGCINVKYSSQRGFHLFPEELEEIKPKICLLTMLDPDHCQEVDLDLPGFKTLQVSPGPKSYWITHGYIENAHRPWLKEMGDELLENDHEANVFVLDWGRAAEPPYTQAVMNVELLGAYIGHLMMRLQEVHGLPVNQTHFIGHSLGAHLGGFVGSWLNYRGGRLGRVTGLDPAQPYFENFPIDTRLDPSDAEFVDVIHTDAKPLLQGGSLTGLGTQEPSGHIDFYPNNGKDQPGCSDGVYEAINQENGSFVYGLRRFFGCNHIRAYEYFTESIRSKCSFRAFACSSWSHFLTANCDLDTCDPEISPQKCNRMGFHAQVPGTRRSSTVNQYWTNGDNSSIPVQNSILYYSVTGRRKPYCREHYLVQLELNGKSAFRTISTDLNLMILGKNGVVDKLRLGARELRGGLSFSYIVAGHLLESPPSRVILKPSAGSPLWGLFLSRVLRHSELTIEFVSIRHLESSGQVILCPEGSPFLRLGEENSSITLSSGSCPPPGGHGGGGGDGVMVIPTSSVDPK